MALDNLNPEEKLMDNSDNKINRREFLQKSAVVAAGSAAVSKTALSYSRIVGANDRISLGTSVSAIAVVSWMELLRRLKIQKMPRSQRSVICGLTISNERLPPTKSITAKRLGRSSIHRNSWL